MYTDINYINIIKTKTIFFLAEFIENFNTYSFNIFQISGFYIFFSSTIFINFIYFI